MTGALFVQHVPRSPQMRSMDEESLEDHAAGAKSDTVQRKSLLNGRDAESTQITPYYYGWYILIFDLILEVLINSEVPHTSVDPASLKKFFWLHRCNLVLTTILLLFSPLILLYF